MLAGQTKDMPTNNDELPLVRCWDAAARRLRPGLTGADRHLLFLAQRYLHEPIGKRVSELSENYRKRYFEIKRDMVAEMNALWPQFSGEGK